MVTETWFGACQPFVAADTWAMVDGLWFPFDSVGTDSIALDPKFPWAPPSAVHSDEGAVIPLTHVERHWTFSAVGSVAGRTVRLRSSLAPWRTGSFVTVLPAEALPGSAPDGYPWRASRNGTVNVRFTDLDRVDADPVGPTATPIGFAPYAAPFPWSAGPPGSHHDHGDHAPQ
ncbi:hypothetical protein AAEP80_01750 [Curtobacterium sp. L3-7]|uniref:hypothetical protein n=1 Tax=Curtobacterium sp. L3-7 TaxID=3138787 RepID=UPI003B524DB0